MAEIHDAAKNGDIARVTQLLDAGADINTPDGKQNTALHHAARYGHIELVQLLIDRGADLNPNEAISGHTPLHKAERWGHDEVVEPAW